MEIWLGGSMRSLRFLLTAILTVAAIPCRTGYTQTKTEIRTPAALTGQVISTEEEPMEGVLVTAKESGSTVAITVVSGEQGQYRIPSTKLEPGHYAITIRAVGFDLDGPTTIDISAQKAAALDLKLRKTANLAMQLTNAEWLESMPGPPEQKSYLRNCVTCHTLQFIVRSTHSADAFVHSQERMSSYVNQSIPEVPQRRLADRLAVQQDRGEEALSRQKHELRGMAEFMSSINLSQGLNWTYSLKTFPRPAGRATHVIITEYDLPKPTRQPHDVIVDSEGMVWYDSFGEEILGKLDPKTGKVTEYPLPLLKPGSPIGSLSLRPDDAGNLWVGMMYQGAAAEFDRKAEKFQTWSLPPEDNKEYTQINQTAPAHSKVDGKVWIQDAGTYTVRRLDLASGKFEVWQPFPKPSPNIYDVIS